MPNLILYNGKLYTQDPNRPQATAVAIRAGRFLAVGNDAEIRALAGPHTRLIDLDGRLALPGMIDAHFHYVFWALGRRQMPLADVASLPDLRERLAQQASKTPPGHWITAMGWNESRWPDPRIPARTDLDDTAPAHPVLLWRYDGHLAVANSRALELACITAATPDPSGGIIDRDESGQPTGVLRELAISLVDNVIPPASEEETIAAMQEGFPILHRLGLTGIHDMGGPEESPAFHPWQQLRAAGELPLRAWVSIPVERLSEAIALGLRTGFGDEYLRVGHVKLFADGSQGARTAWVIEPYEDGGCGMPIVSPVEIADVVRRADEAGLAVAIHSIGDRANREVLDVFERVTCATPLAAPHRIEHVQNIRLDDARRLARLDVAASVQPVHVVDDMRVIEQSVGSRARFTYAFRDLLDAGATLALGSDCPVSDPNPLWGIHAAVTRQQRDGVPAGGWYPAQRLSVTEAVWGFTMGPALVSGQEAELGSITPGKLADLIVLDRDIFTIDPAEIANVKPTLTIFHGQEVYRA